MAKQYKPADPRVDPSSLIPAFVISYSDSGFTLPHTVVSRAEPEFDPDAFTFIGKEMDGFESGRHWAITALPERPTPSYRYDPNAHNQIRIGFARRSQVRQLEVSTEWFTGNQVQEVSVWLIDADTGRESQLLEREPLAPDRKHFFAVADEPGTELRVDCYPDGGIARIRCYGPTLGGAAGSVVGSAAESPAIREDLLADAGISHVSNDHYGRPADAVAGYREVAQMRGWESGRTGFGEQALFALSSPCTVEELVVDSFCHVLNTPLSCHLFGLTLAPDAKPEQLEAEMRRAPCWKLVFDDGTEVIPDDLRGYMRDRRYQQVDGGGSRPFTIALHQPDGPWRAILGHGPLQRDTYNRFTDLAERGPFTHVLFLFFPNGGIHGLHLYGRRVG